MAGTPTLYHREERRVWGPDLDGVQRAFKDYDSVISYTWDLSDQLASGETISSVTWESNGPTLSSSSATSTTYTTTVTGLGAAKATIVTSNSQTIVKRYRWEDDTSAGKDVPDYG